MLDPRTFSSLNTLEGIHLFAKPRRTLDGIGYVFRLVDSCPILKAN